MGVDLPTPQLNDLVYEVERFYHGNPSGIDNTVVCYEKAMFFAKGSNPATFTPIRPFAIVIADTGRPASTKAMVGKVRAGWKKDQDYFNRIFSEIGNIVLQARSIIESGNPNHLGPLMVANHELLKHLDVSSPELDHLVDTALKSGALGAKLSGGGGGGNLIALVNEDTYLNVTEALYQEGAVRVIHTEI
jgi:mevalonate kinase